MIYTTVMIFLTYTSAAFKQLNFSSDDVMWVYQCCAGILHLSNVAFKADGEGSKIDPASNTALQNAARFLKVHTAYAPSLIFVRWTPRD